MCCVVFREASDWLHTAKTTKTGSVSFVGMYMTGSPIEFVSLAVNRSIPIISKTPKLHSAKTPETGFVSFGGIRLAGLRKLG
jgi:hypothetical protein